MGKRFEGPQPTLRDVVAGYQLLGIGNLLGSSGEHTAFSLRPSAFMECLEIHTLPGHFTAAEVAGLLRDAGR